MTIHPTVCKAALLILALAVSLSGQAGEVLESVNARDQLRCGVSADIPGFSTRDGDSWRGLDIDFCRAVAAAVLGDPDKAQFVPLAAAARFPALKGRKIDLLLNNTTWTLTREAVLKIQFPGILFYDGQGFMVPATAGISRVGDLNGATICVEKGTTSLNNLISYFKTRGGEVKPLVMDSASEAATALFAGRCRAYTSDAAQLAALRLRAPENPQDFVILPERISREPLTAAIWTGDLEWGTVVRWVLNSLILAEEYGVTRDNLDALIAENQNPLIRGSDEERDRIAKALGLAPRWGERAIRAVGNYGEIYERNVGRDSPLKIERGLNRLWNQGGLHYAPPLD